MSTKIYNAFYFDKIKTLDDFHIKLGEFNQKYHSAIIELYEKENLLRIINYFDSVDVFDNIAYGENCYDYLIKNAELSIQSYYLKGFKKLNEFNFSTIMYLKKHNDKLYCKIFSEKDIITKMLINFFDLKDFHYQNSSDSHSGISNEDWIERENIWHELLNTNNWITSGFTPVKISDFCPDFCFPNSISFYQLLDKDKDNLIFLSKENRIRNFLKNNIFYYLEQNSNIKKASEWRNIMKITQPEHPNNFKYKDLEKFIIEQFNLYAPELNLENFLNLNNLNCWDKTMMNYSILKKVKKLNLF